MLISIINRYTQRLSITFEIVESIEICRKLLGLSETPPLNREMISLVLWHGEAFPTENFLNTFFLDIVSMEDELLIFSKMCFTLNTFVSLDANFHLQDFYHIYFLYIYFLIAINGLRIEFILNFIIIRYARVSVYFLKF